MSYHRTSAEVAQAVEQWTENPLHMTSVGGRKMVIRMQDVEVVTKKLRIRPKKRMLIVEELTKVQASRKRTPAPARPEGSLTIREAAALNEIPFGTLARWVDKSRNHPASCLFDKIKILGTSENCVYLEPESVKVIADKYKQDKGRGKRTVYKELQTA